MDPYALKTLNAERRARRAAILVTDLCDGRDRIVREGDQVAGDLGAAIAKAFRTGNSGSVEAEGRTFFLNAHLPQPRLVVIGAVHISQALAPMAKIAGYPVEIVDPRTAFATPERFPDVALHAEWPDDVLKRQPLDSYTALAAVTHDPKIDDFALKAALDANCFYIGALGSRKTHAKRIERLLALGASAEQIARIHAPIGLDIGAASPAEIAVAVLAQAIQAFRSRGLEAAASAPKSKSILEKHDALTQNSRASFARPKGRTALYGRGGVKFGPIPIETAEGAVLAHATTAGERRFRKAHRLSADDLSELRAAGITEIVAAVLAPDDLGEDAAAEKIAASMRHRNVEAKPAATGRVNLHAEAAGIFTVDAAMIDAINAVDPTITIATLAQYAPVEKGQMVATVKIIPFAVSSALVDAVTKICAGGEILAVNAYQPVRVGVIQTVLPGIKPSVLDKTLRVTEARLARSGGRLTAERRTPHEIAPVAEAAASLARDNDLVVIFGASAMSDFADVVPAAIEKAGGTVIRAGMPVDPGNLLVLGTLGGKRVIGAPGCARSPKENGFDWVLDRLIAGLDVTARDIAGMGVGGLLMEIPTRPQPREPLPAKSQLKVGIVLLAAGRSSRMGGPNKLLALFDGKPLVRRTAERALGSKASGTIIVTGHQRERVRAALAGLEVAFADNPDFTDGLSTSLKAGIAHLPEDAAGVMIVLGDMPGVASDDLDRLIDAFRKAGGNSVVRASHEGKRGNPVLLPRSLFPAIAHLEGDTGARHLVETEGLDVIDVEIGEAASVDVDTREALEGAGGVLQD